VASRTEDVVLAFMSNPNAANAKELGIRENPTGQLAGVVLSAKEVALITEAMTTLFEIKPPAGLGSEFERVEVLLTEKTCMACHTLAGEGAPDGGIGGPLESAADMDLEILTAWLIEPTFENATKFKLRDFVTGAMASFALPEEDAKLMAQWIKTLKPSE
ncbi:cytochrome c, partial [bacterium]|nr:cytochrome c [bacterium]